MARKLPPLTALRAFEAAGRHESFTRAAEELFVTQAAVSRQVRELEQWFGRALFERRHRRVVLTEAGRRLLDHLSASFDALGTLAAALRDQPAEIVVPVSVDPTFAALWLVPRLARFRAERPDIDILVDADGRMAEFRGDGIQLAIRHSLEATAWPRVESLHLAEVEGFPVLAPSLLAGGPMPRDPADLMRFPLLHEENRELWARWFEPAGIDDPAIRRGALFMDAGHAIQAALMGQGVAFGYSLMVADALRAGRLVKPFARAVPLGAYWLVAPDFGRLAEPARLFASWLRREMRDFLAEMADRAG